MKYNIKLVSLTNSIFTIIILMAAYMSILYVIIPYMHRQGFLAIPLTAAMFMISYFVWQKFVIGRTQWEISNAGITMDWVKQFAFTKKDGMNLKWSEINKCSERSDGGLKYRVFKIKLTSGYGFTFYHDTLVTRDDYDAFQKELQKYLTEKKIMHS